MLVGVRAQAYSPPGDTLAGHRPDAHAMAMVGTLPRGALLRAWQQARLGDFQKRVSLPLGSDFPGEEAARCSCFLGHEGICPLSKGMLWVLSV